MKCTYLFKDTKDVLVGETLTRDKYAEFVSELREMNSTYDYKIFLGGSYLEYLTRTSNTYNDVDFFVMGEKIIDLNDLTDFFKKFHELAKKYRFVYDLNYYMDANSDNLNMDSTKFHILNVEKTSFLRLYRIRITNLEQDVEAKLVDNSELFEGVLDIKKLNKKYVVKRQTKQFFQKPLKIT